VSPRSEEFARLARERLAAARHSIDAGDFSVSVSVAYYAMLYAARAALSEEDQNAKTHSGTWNLFRSTFVESGRFNRELADQASEAQRAREGADYDARAVSADEGEAVVALAERFVAAVAELVDG
jgi:uncharacterized protein (UPF0332 family)